MRTSEQIKGKVKHFAKMNHLHAQEVLQMYFFERILERLAQSPYKDAFILKGGLLISSLTGIHNRTTMDMDTTVRGIALHQETIRPIMEEIFAMDLGDGMTFTLQDITTIREQDAYENFRIHFLAKYGKMNNPMKIDITTGDAITPGEIVYAFPKMFDDEVIHVMAYPLETVLAEKIETILRRNIANTRMRDFYDVYLLYRHYEEKINATDLRDALQRTAQKRKSREALQARDEMLADIKEDPYLRGYWENYRRDNPYVGTTEFDDTLSALQELIEKVFG